ncbi:MAG: hypothetical protein R2761_30350 [Acidimicrobiales bacterium]
MAQQAHLEAARVRRETLHEALIGLEDALTTPIGDAARWRLRVAMAVDHAAQRLHQHIRQTEAPDGFLRLVVQDDPRMACRADRLARDHGPLVEAVERLQYTLATIADEEVVAHGYEVRNQALDLMTALMRHRQRGADFIYEAYQVDIGAQ